MVIDKLNSLSYDELLLVEKLRKFQKENINEDKTHIILESINIFSEYTNLNNNIEALKRAVFIQWYGASEQSIYSRIICKMKRMN